jgi:hypothetical protein
MKLIRLRPACARKPQGWLRGRPPNLPWCGKFARAWGRQDPHGRGSRSSKARRGAQSESHTQYASRGSTDSYPVERWEPQIEAAPVNVAKSGGELSGGATSWCHGHGRTCRSGLLTPTRSPMASCTRPLTSSHRTVRMYTSHTSGNADHDHDSLGMTEIKAKRRPGQDPICGTPGGGPGFKIDASRTAIHRHARQGSPVLRSAASGPRRVCRGRLSAPIRNRSSMTLPLASHPAIANRPRRKLSKATRDPRPKHSCDRTRVPLSPTASG